MIAFAKSWNKLDTKFPFRPNNQVKILDIYDRIATVRRTSGNWVAYLQLIKLDDTWQIMHLFANIKM